MAAKPEVARLQRACPGLDPDLVREHLQRLGGDYFEAFSEAEIAGHLQALALLSPQNPVQVRVGRNAEGLVSCTVLAFDHPSVFALITGSLTGLGFSILSGHVFTYAPACGAPPSVRGRRPASAARGGFRRRRIIDHFEGELTEDLELVAWRERLAAELERLTRLLQSGETGDFTRAKHRVNESVAAALTRLESREHPMLYPVDISVDNDRGACTRLRVVAQDTPGFLYALSNALALRGIGIEHVRIRTIHGMVEDEIDVLDGSGRKITGAEPIDRLKLSVLLTKQFTYFLGRAPDPFAALSRFEQLSEEVLGLPDRGRWLEHFSNPRALEDLARILGASDFIWEDFVRGQYEALLPILGSHLPQRRPSFSREALRRRLREAMAGATDYAARREALNAFKDREIFAADLDHILHGGADVRGLAENLTVLAELVVDRAARSVYEEWVKRHGRPRTVGGLGVQWSVLGLGKLGGAALGYASDVELLFVYGDSGRTDGSEALDNAEFFDRLALEVSRFVQAKREGIFRVDLRLRPYGESGPRACSLEGFCRYYGADGPAHAYERLALVRLRHVGGDAGLGGRLERLRDAYIYGTRAVDTEALKALRERQFEVKARGSGYNAKFSPGALVDLEYFVQLLQVQHGGAHVELRTPRIHEALSALSRAGVLQAEESARLADAYYFLRRLVNGLRMLRGNALDLCLPEPGSDEFAHLARRMGYERGGDLAPEDQLHLEFDTQTAVIRAFIERHFGRESLPDPEHGNVADVVLSERPPRALLARVLSAAGFEDPDRAHANLKRLAGDGTRRAAFARLAVLAFDALQGRADPDMALNNWERFVAALPDADRHYDLLLSQPRRLDILLGLFSGSQFLADTLVRHPDFLDWATDPGQLLAVRSRAALERDFRRFVGPAPGHESWLAGARRFRRREIVRIGARDICLGVSIRHVLSDLSMLAEVLVDVMLEKRWEEMLRQGLFAAGARPDRDLCVIALGKLGGRELNYSSDIDLLGIRSDGAEVDRRLLVRALEGLRADLSSHTPEGYAYRVDLRLRAHGGAGELVQPLSALLSYFENRAQLWEVQALLKARPVAGNPALGERFMAGVRSLLTRRRPWPELVASVRTMRDRALANLHTAAADDVKSGPGGIRDVEFLVQALQLKHAAEHPDLLTGNTLRALGLLRSRRLLPSARASALEEDYVFLRRLEHYLQIHEDRQVHSLPRRESDRHVLARRLFGPAAGRDRLREHLQAVCERVRAAFERELGAGAR